MEKLKNNLAGIVSLIGVVGAIGAGFTTYGQLIANIEILEEKVSELNARQYVINETVDLTDTNNKINENYETTLDRISDIKQQLSDNKNNLEIIKTRLDLIDAQLQGIKNENKNPLAK
jgi:predicted  nucleic acid-binding Zn-ribbon protein